jgi:hypothetical protein
VELAESQVFRSQSSAFKGGVISSFYANQNELVELRS